MLYRMATSVCCLFIIIILALFTAPSVKAKSNGLAIFSKIKTALHDDSRWQYLIVGIIFLFIIHFIYQSRSKKNAQDKTKGSIVMKTKEPITIQNTVNRVTPGNGQHIGARTEQQDAFGFSDIHDVAFIKQFGVLAVLADGMGGLVGGREVSQLAVKNFIDHYLHSPYITSIPEKLASSAEVANDAVLQFARENALEGCVGTTLIASVVHNDELYWLSVGDSRIYLYQKDGMSQLSTDHIYAKELDEKAEKGLITLEEARNDPQRESLTSFLGQERIEEIDISLDPVPIHKEDKVLLCSDGLYGSVTSDDFLEICHMLPAQEAAEKLIVLALDKGKPNQDNATIAILSLN